MSWNICCVCGSGRGGGASNMYNILDFCVGGVKFVFQGVIFMLD